MANLTDTYWAFLGTMDNSMFEDGTKFELNFTDADGNRYAFISFENGGMNFDGTQIYDNTGTLVYGDFAIIHIEGGDTVENLNLNTFFKNYARQLPNAVLGTWIFDDVGVSDLLGIFNGTGNNVRFASNGQEFEYISLSDSLIYSSVDSDITAFDGAWANDKLRFITITEELDTTNKHCIRFILGYAATKLTTISTAEELKAINMSGNYILGADIDLSGVSSWIPLGTSATQSSTGAKFEGSLYGDGHCIKNLTINRNTSDKYNFVGLFGKLGTCTIQDLVIKNASVTVSGANPCIGILAGHIYYGNAKVSNISTQGELNIVHTYMSTEYAYRGVAGMVGSSYGGGCTFTDCISTVNINISGCSNRTCYTAGFIGYGSGVTLTRCYAFGNITVTNTGDTALTISGMQSLCYKTTHNNCACAVNIYGATEGTVRECCKYLTRTSSFTNTNSRRYWANASVSWESYSSSSDVSFTETDMESIIGTNDLDKYNLEGLDFSNGKYLKLAIDDTVVSYDITLFGITYTGVKSVRYNGNTVKTFTIDGVTYKF